MLRSLRAAHRGCVRYCKKSWCATVHQCISSAPFSNSLQGQCKWGTARKPDGSVSLFDGKTVCVLCCAVLCCAVLQAALLHLFVDSHEQAASSQAGAAEAG
jgi:hypothetical protein